MEMSKFVQGDSEWAGLFGVVEEYPKFGFSSRGYNLFHDMTEDIDGAIDCGVGARQQIEVASCSGPGLGHREVKCIALKGELHAGGRKADSGFRVGMTIIK
jgi:hypothetical protein